MWVIRYGSHLCLLNHLADQESVFLITTYFSSKRSFLCQGDDLEDKVLAMQAQGPDFESPEHT